MASSSWLWSSFQNWSVKSCWGSGRRPVQHFSLLTPPRSSPIAHNFFYLFQLFSHTPPQVYSTRLMRLTKFSAGPEGRTLGREAEVPLVRRLAGNGGHSPLGPRKNQFRIQPPMVAAP